MDLNYPQVGFHFLVVFELFPQLPNDFRFQEVSGLTATMEMEPIKEGGENRFVHQLPVRTSYSELVLKRGKFMGSGILHWCKNAIENYEFKPTNIMISLLNDDHLPLYNWYVINAIPKRLEISGFNAERSEVVIETMALNYQYFKYYDPASAAMDLAGSLTGSINVNIGF
ncbi:MAG: phage tail protein [Cyclobacteriaceae bacterium]